MIKPSKVKFISEIYTITAENEIQLVSAILEWFNHSEYERKFHY